MMQKPPWMGFDAQAGMVQIHRHPSKGQICTKGKNCLTMKATIAVLLAGALCLGLIAADKPAATGNPQLIGTWEMVSTKYADAEDFTPVGDEMKALKFITPTHFIWTHFDPKTKKISNSMGGTYTCEGESYIETPQFALEGMETYLGKPQKFTVKIEGDKLTQSGALSDGMKLQEIWKRVK